MDISAKTRMTVSTIYPKGHFDFASLKYTRC